MHRETLDQAGRWAVGKQKSDSAFGSELSLFKTIPTKSCQPFPPLDKMLVNYRHCAIGQGNEWHPPKRDSSIPLQRD
jgi:hypothetical protein